MAKEYGVIALKRLLKKAKKMSVEEYNVLYEDTLRDIEEIKASGVDYQVLVHYDPKIENRFYDGYLSFNKTISLSFKHCQTSFVISNSIKEFNPFQKMYFFEKDNPEGYDIGKIEMKMTNAA